MSLVHWLVVALVIIVIFGAGKLPRVMGDLAEGIKAFKRGMKDEDDKPSKKLTDDGIVEHRAETKVKDRTEV